MVILEGEGTSFEAGYCSRCLSYKNASQASVVALGNVLQALGPHETCVLFHMSAWTNHWQCSNFSLFVVYVTMSLKNLRTRLIWSRSVHRLRRHTVVKYLGLWLFYIFHFLISPTGRKSVPIRTRNGLNDVLSLVYGHFQGLEPIYSLLRDFRLEKHQHSDPF